MKKLFFSIMLPAAVVLAMAGCAGRNEPIMDQPAADGNYHYRNRDLGFSLTLPPEFEYYQTQRKETGNYVEIEFFVPTGDAGYAMEVPGYAKPATVRIFSRRAWESEDESGADAIYRMNFSAVAESGDRVYAIRFWDNIPADWSDKWSGEMAGKIRESFRIK